ncbi:MAG: hypothetical protein K8U03_05950 [Planctomycetia bacterium]|nr:hypothetical protein [Planctomycetia bacterium]
MQRSTRELIERAKRAIGEGTVLRHASPSIVAVRREVAVRKKNEPLPAEVHARINTLAIDRHDTIVDPAGCDASSFVRNPVLLWQHGLDAVRGNLPLGTVPELMLQSDFIDVVARFDLGDPFSANIHRMFDAGILKAFSIGFIGRAFSIDEVATEGVNQDGNPVSGTCEILRFTDWDLAELSAVAVGSNPDALVL